MSHTNQSERKHEETCGLGLSRAESRKAKKGLGQRSKAEKAPVGMARLRAENEALRSQINHLQKQWDVLKDTLGILSTTVCSNQSP